MSATAFAATHARRLPASALGVLEVLAVLVVAYGILPLAGSKYLFDAIPTLFRALSLTEPGRKYVRIVFREGPVRRSISRIGIPPRQCQPRITLDYAMSITP